MGLSTLIPDIPLYTSILFIEFCWGKTYELYKSYDGKIKKGGGL